MNWHRVSVDISRWGCLAVICGLVGAGCGWVILWVLLCARTSALLPLPQKMFLFLQIPSSMGLCVPANPVLHGSVCTCKSYPPWVCVYLQIPSSTGPCVPANLSLHGSVCTVMLSRWSVTVSSSGQTGPQDEKWWRLALYRRLAWKHVRQASLAGTLIQAFLPPELGM